MTSFSANQPTGAQKRLFESVSPALRGSFARDILSDYRRWVLKQIDAASKAGATEYLREMEKLKERLAGEFDLAVRGDAGVIKRSLTEYREFLLEINKR